VLLRRWGCVAVYVALEEEVGVIADGPAKGASLINGGAEVNAAPQARESAVAFKVGPGGPRAEGDVGGGREAGFDSRRLTRGGTDQLSASELRNLRAD